MGNKTTISLNIGGQERMLKFSMDTLEMFMNESKKFGDSGLTNPITRLKLLFYCGLVIGDKKTKTLPEDFNIDDVSDWISECDQDEFEPANDMALTAMGFIEQAEEQEYSRSIRQMKLLGGKPEEIINQALSKMS